MCTMDYYHIFQSLDLTDDYYVEMEDFGSGNINYFYFYIYLCRIYLFIYFCIKCTTKISSIDLRIATY